MTMLCKKLLSGLLALMLLLTLAPAAFAEETLLKVVLTGLYAQADGSYNKVEQNAVFDVYQDNQKIGALNVTPGGENTIALPGTGSVALVPVAGSYPAELPLNVYGYGVAVAANRLNIAPIEVIANAAAPAAPVVPTAPTAAPAVTAAPAATEVPVAAPTPTIAPVSDGALFILLAEVEASFELRTEDGELVLSFQTDAEGNYATEKALPEGTYVLSMTVSKEEPWPDMFVDLWMGEVQIIHSPFWRPNKTNTMNVRAAVTAVPADGAAAATPVPTAEPTAEPTVEPTVEPTMEPTAAPTATLAPTEAPTAEPTAAPTATLAPTEAPAVEPTAAPTAALELTEAPEMAPTAAPTATAAPTDVPEIAAAPAETATGGIFIMAEGFNVPVQYTISVGETVYAAGRVSVDDAVYMDGIPAGDCLFTLQLPETAVLNYLNGNPTMERGTVQWQGQVIADQDNFYYIEFEEAGGVTVQLEGISGADVRVTGNGENLPMTDKGNGLYVGEGLLVGNYTVNVTLPAGHYEYDASKWTMVQNADGTCTAMASVTIEAGAVLELPGFVSSQNGFASGFVTDVNGAMLSGVTVDIYDESGKAVARAVTDKNGQWRIENLAYGTYRVQYTEGTRAFPAGSFAIDANNENAALSVAAAQIAKISVNAFVDANSNGTKGKSEDGLRNVEVALVTVDGAVVATGVTAKNGEVTLSAPEGKYHLRVNAPAGYGFGPKGTKLSAAHSLTGEYGERTQQSELIELTKSTLEVGVGFVRAGSVTGIVWNDKNGDGVYQDDEPGVPGVKMTLVGKKNDVTLEAVTDENGVYTFYQTTEGTFSLNCHVPDDYVFTAKISGKANANKASLMTTEADRIGSVDIKLKNAQVYEAQQIGLMEGVIIEGVCFYDVNYNGVYDEADEPLPGVQLRLARQSNNVLLQHVVSDENGEYHFVGQRGSTFTLRANLEKGCIFTILGSGEEANMFKPNGDKTERRLTGLTIENGGYQKINMGAIKYGSIGGRVYYDDNFSSDWEKGERVMSGKVVTLYDANGEKVATKKTDKNGLFTFTKLMPDKYTVGLEPAKGYAFTSLGANNMMQAQLDGTGRSRVIELRMGQEVTNASAGMIVPAYVSGVLFADENDNGRYDQGEKGLEGAVVRLMGENGEANTVTIGQSAEFMFSAAPGRYYLEYQLPDGGIFATVTEGGNTITGENGVGQSDWFTVGTGDTWNATLCGGLLLSDISGMAFTDSNGNSVMDVDEFPLAGVVITFTPSRGDLSVASIVTGEDGRYAFNDLRPDTYTLNVTCPNGAVLSRMPGMMMNIVHGKNNQTVQQKIEIGTQWHQQNMGCVVPSSWSGEAYLDENYDGVRAGNEAPAVGEQIVLMDALTGEAVSTVLTDASGKFVIEGIAPGEYELTYPMDEGNLVPLAGSCDFYQEGDGMTNGRVVIRENEEKSGTVLAVVRTTEISGEVLLEQHDGVHPVKGATLHLLDAFGSPISEFTTAEDGKYAFKGLMPNSYAVDVTIPAGYVLVENGDPRLAENGLVSFVEEAQGLFGQSSVINLRMADHHKDMDVVMVLPGRLGDKAWLDLNGNGLQDGDEGGIPGVTIELFREDKLLATTVTDQYGYYVFEQLYPTDYILRATWPSEVKPTVLRTDLQQIVSVLQEDGTTIPVRVESNKASYAADLGFVLVEEGNLPAGYGEGEAQVWKK